MIFLAIENGRTSLSNNIFLRIDKKEFILVISMAETEENSGYGASFGKLIESLALQELFDIRLLLNFWRVIASETSS